MWLSVLVVYFESVDGSMNDRSCIKYELSRDKINGQRRGSEPFKRKVGRRFGVGVKFGKVKEWRFFVVVRSCGPRLIRSLRKGVGVGVGVEIGVGIGVGV